jgi:hypothetical protein
MGVRLIVIFLTFMSNYSNRINADYTRVFTLCDKLGKIKIVTFCPFTTTNPS